MKIRAELFQCEQTGRHDERSLIIACRYFANVPKIVLIGFYTIKTILLS